MELSQDIAAELERLKAGEAFAEARTEAEPDREPVGKGVEHLEAEAIPHTPPGAGKPRWTRFLPAAVLLSMHCMLTMLAIGGIFVLCAAD